MIPADLLRIARCIEPLLCESPDRLVHPEPVRCAG